MVAKGHICWLLVAAGMLSIAAWPAVGADLVVTPSVRVSQEYTDNVFDSPVNVEDLITSVAPGIALRYRAPLWEWNAAYTFDYLHYAFGHKDDEFRHTANVQGKIEVVPEFMFIELSDVYQIVPVNIARDPSAESPTSNQTDQNLGSVSPYLVFHPNKALTVKSGYRYVNNWYKDSTATDRRAHSVFLNATDELGQKLFLSAGYTMTREDTSSYGFYRHEMSAGPRYEYADRSFLFAQGGASLLYYDNQPETINPLWNAGITHSFDTFTATFSTGVTYTDDPIDGAVQQTNYMTSLQKNFARGTTNLLCSYTEYLKMLTDETTTKRFTSGFTIAYELMTDLRGLLGFTYERYLDLAGDTSTNRYYVDSGLSYSLAQNLSISIAYKFVEYTSPNNAFDNRTINRAIVEVRKSF